MPDNNDFPSINLWRAFLFLLATESPRPMEASIAVWAFIFGCIVLAGGGRTFHTALAYTWLISVPAPLVALPMIALGIYQVWAVLSSRRAHRHWAARWQVILSVVFAIGCTICAGFSSPAWAFFGSHALWSIWTLWRLAPVRKLGV